MGTSRILYSIDKFAATVACAVARATGAEVAELPLTPPRVLARLRDPQARLTLPHIRARWRDNTLPVLS
jgi:hypothetical protein